jgi:hypothetical protein
MNPKNALPVVAAAAASPGALAALAPFAAPIIVGGIAGLAIAAILNELFSDDEKPAVATLEGAVLDIEADVENPVETFEESEPPAELPPARSTQPSLGCPARFDPSPTPGRPLPAPLTARPSCRARRVSVADLQAVFAGGPLPRGEAVVALRRHVGCGKTAAYRALAPGSLLSEKFVEDERGRLTFRG